ncbi:MAG: carbohydrate ABC transporter permease [Chloroflexota bacterium]
MLNFLFSTLLWLIIGAVPGFYAAYFKRHDPRYGVLGGAAIGFVVGTLGMSLGIIDTATAAFVTIAGVVLVIALLVPFGTHNERVTRQTRLNYLAYALLLPTVLIVLGIVIFPVVWNLIFSLRPIETGDLATVNLLNLENASLENFDDKLGLTLKTTECLPAFDPYFILYEGVFDPEDATQGFVVVDTGARTETGNPTIIESLEAETQYYVVMTGNTENALLEFETRIDGPGAIFLGQVGDDAEQTDTYQAATSEDQVFERPSRTGSRAQSGDWLYHAQPLYVTATGEYTITAVSTEASCRRDENDNVVYASLTDAGITDYSNLTSVTVGGEHYIVAARDPEFYHVIVRTLFYTLSGTILAILFGLVCALVVREQFIGRAIFRGFILFPYIAPVISVAFVWQVMLRQNGPINSLMGTDVPFLNPGAGEFLGISVPLVMAILFQAWRYFPFAFLFLLARIQAIPEDMYEAAKVDGASPVQRLWFITLPQLRTVFATLFLLRFIWTFNKFDDIYLLTGNISDTRVITVEIFDALFTLNNVGQASAIAIVMAVMLAFVLLIYFRFFLAEEE